MQVKNLADRTVVSSGAKWEDIVGYSRAVRKGGLIFVTGTIGINPDGTYPNGVEAQTRRAFEIIIGAIEALGGVKEDIVRNRIFIKNADDWEEVAKVHRELFNDIRPCCTMVEISDLVGRTGLLEIECEAVMG